jgi:molecular chaperone DnaK (HSP70)
MTYREQEAAHDSFVKSLLKELRRALEDAGVEESQIRAALQKAYGRFMRGNSSP